MIKVFKGIVLLAVLIFITSLTREFSEFLWFVLILMDIVIMFFYIGVCFEQDEE